MPPQIEEYLTETIIQTLIMRFSLMINSTTKQFLHSCLVLCFITSMVCAQDPLRFKKEIEDLVATDSAVKEEHLIIFAGSSSFRLWKEMTIDFKEYNVINRGFGGSEMSDLLYYADELILKHRPEKIFIYEGDNDLGAKRPVDTIIHNANLLVKKFVRNFRMLKFIF